MTPDDETAWRRAVAGDGEAFGLLFDAHGDRAYRHALRLTRNAQDAQDVAAAAFLELWRRRADVRLVDDSVLPWLLATTTNLALNQRRGLRRHRDFLARLPGRDQAVESAETHALAKADLDVDPALRAGIGALRLVDQQLLALVALEGYPLKAAAAALGMSEQAARSRWQRIRRRLARHGPAEPLAVAADH